MNLSEIRAKYPQYDSISDDVLVQKLHDKYYPQMDIKEFSDRIGYQKQTINKENVPNAVRWVVNRMQKEGRTEPSLWENIVVGLSGAGQGASGALNRGASSLTLSGSDYIQRKMGENPYETVEKIIDSTKSPTVAGLVGLASGGAEVAGGLPLGAGTFKLAAGLPKYGRLAAGVGTSAGMGGISSAFNSDFDPRETAKGAITGATIDLGLRGAGKGLAKVFSAAEKIKGVPRGLANAAGNDKGASILDRAVKESKKTAKQVYAQAPEALDTINRRATEQIDDAVRGVDVKGRMAGAKKAYGDFIDENKANQILQGKGNQKQAQLDYILKNNPAGKDSNATWIRKIEDINTLDEALKQPDWVGYNEFNPDYTSEMARKAIKSGKIKVYSSNPIEKGNFVTPSKMEAQSYSGNGKIFEKEIPIKDVAWIDPTQGQYAPVSSVKSAPKVSDLGISNKLSKAQNKALNTAWKQGADSLKKGEAIGSLKHIDKMKESLNKMIEKSKVPNPNGIGTVDTTDTVALRELKGYLKETMDNAGLSGISKQYREAKRLEEAFNAGKKFNPNAQKVSDFKLKTADERNAFAQGLADKAKLNPESKNIAGKVADVRGALRETIGEKANPLFNNIDELDRTYQNVSNLRNLAGRKLVKADPIGKLTAGPIRELGDSIWSPVFALADVARRYATGKAAARASKYLLNPNLKVGRSWNDAIQPAIPSISTYLSNKRNKKGDK